MGDFSSPFRSGLGRTLANVCEVPLTPDTREGGKILVTLPIFLVIYSHFGEKDDDFSLRKQKKTEHTNSFSMFLSRYPPCHQPAGRVYCYAEVSSLDSFALAFFLGFCSVSVGIVMSSEIFKGERLQVLTCGDKGCCRRPSPSSLHKQ